MKAKIILCLLFIQLSALFFMQQFSLAREIEIDGTLKVELVNNEMSYEDSVRVFNYVKSALYDKGYYSDAQKDFQKIVDYASSGRNTKANFFLKLIGKDYNDFNVKDDALYYIGKCEYHRGNPRIADGDFFTFEQVYHLYPEGSVVKSGQLQSTLLSILGKEATDFDRMLRIYNLLAKIHSESMKTARQIIEKKLDEKHIVRWTIREWVPVKIYDVLDGRVQYDSRRLREYFERRIVYSFESYGEKFANHVWHYFLDCNLSKEQTKSLTSLVEKNKYLDFGSCHRLKLFRSDAKAFSEDCVECDVAVEVRFRELLKATGIDLFDIGRGKEGDI